MKILKLIVAMFILSSFGCVQNSMNPNAGTYLRIINETGYEVEDLTIDNVYFGNLNSSEVSEYKMMNPLWEAPKISVSIGGKKKQYLPTDHVGEEPLSAGRYTARLILYDQDGNFIPILEMKK